MTGRPSPPLAPPAHGDPDAWVDLYGDALLRFAIGRVACCQAAEDVVQETFLAAFRSRQQFDGKSAFGTWLISILRRKIVDHQRKSSRSPLGDAETPATVDPIFLVNGKWAQTPAHWRSNPKQLVENAEFWGVLEACVAGLPHHLAEAFRARELNMLSVEDASLSLNVTRQHLAVRLHRARLLLRQCLETRWFQGRREGVL